MPRSIAALATFLIFAVPAPPAATEAEATVLLLDNAELCLRVGRASADRAGPSPAQTAARALARETLAIAGELLESSKSASEPGRLGFEVFRLQEQVCGEAHADRNLEDLETRLRSAVDSLEESAELESAGREKILARFLERRDEAISSGLEAELHREQASQGAAVQSSGDEDRLAHRSSDGGWLETVTSGVSAEAVGKAPAGATESVRPALARDVDSDSTSGSKPGTDGPDPQEIWSPAPAQMAARRQQNVSSFQGRMAAWRPTYKRELRELAALRSTLARELEGRSLQHVRSLCSQLVGVVDRVEYAVVLGAPEPTVRQFLDRMLAGYAAAGRWCSSGRFAFAWIEIEKADQRWQQISARLSSFDGG
jgi:hypothetical protein